MMVVQSTEYRDSVLCTLYSVPPSSSLLPVIKLTVIPHGSGKNLICHGRCEIDVKGIRVAVKKGIMIDGKLTEKTPCELCN